MLCEYIDQFGDDTQIAVILSSEYSEDWEEVEYKILSERGIEYVPERAIISIFDAKQ